jgi:hypothetical protein
LSLSKKVFWFFGFTVYGSIYYVETT